MRRKKCAPPNANWYPYPPPRMDYIEESYGTHSRMRTLGGNHGCGNLKLSRESSPNRNQRLQPVATMKITQNQEALCNKKSDNTQETSSGQQKNAAPNPQNSPTATQTPKTHQQPLLTPKAHQQQFKPTKLTNSSSNPQTSPTENIPST